MGAEVESEWSTPCVAQSNRVSPNKDGLVCCHTFPICVILLVAFTSGTPASLLRSGFVRSEAAGWNT